jgi:hypothetical protein
MTSTPPGHTSCLFLVDRHVNPTSNPISCHRPSLISSGRAHPACPIPGSRKCRAGHTWRSRIIHRRCNMSLPRCRSALAISASTTYESLNENAKKALKWLLLAGSRVQTGSSLSPVSPQVAQLHINQINKYLPDNSQLGVSLHNGAKAFVVAGPARAPCDLVKRIRVRKIPTILQFPQ